MEESAFIRSPDQDEKSRSEFHRLQDDRSPPVTPVFRPVLEESPLILTSSKSFDSSSSMYPKIQGDRKALVAARRPRNPSVDNKKLILHVF